MYVWSIVVEPVWDGLCSDWTARFLRCQACGHLHRHGNWHWRYRDRRWLRVWICRHDSGIFDVLHGPPDPPDSSAGDTEDATAKERLAAMLAAMLCRKRLRPLCRWEDLWQRDVQGGGPLVPCVGGPLLTPPGFTSGSSGANTQTGGFQRFGTLQGPKVPGAKLTVGMVTSRFEGTACTACSRSGDVDGQVNDGTHWLWTDHGGPSQQFRFWSACPFVLATCWRESRVSISSPLGSRVWSVAL